jgi:hypothetical protein
MCGQQLCRQRGAKSDVYEEDDTPHPIGHADVAHWLQLSDATHINMAALPTSAAPMRRGVYHSTQVGKEISLRRAQEMRKVERERKAKEEQEDMRRGFKPSRLSDFFSCRQPVSRNSGSQSKINDIDYVGYVAGRLGP